MVFQHYSLAARLQFSKHLFSTYYVPEAKERKMELSWPSLPTSDSKNNSEYPEEYTN